jgi:hypothetical protein
MSRVGGSHVAKLRDIRPRRDVADATTLTASASTADQKGPPVMRSPIDPFNPFDRFDPFTSAVELAAAIR